MRFEIPEICELAGRQPDALLDVTHPGAVNVPIPTIDDERLRGNDTHALLEVVPPTDLAAVLNDAH
jgi:hypothetical protein